MNTDLLEFYAEVLKVGSSNTTCDQLRKALKLIKDSYRRMSHNGNCIFVDYNQNHQRYAYIYYFAVCHTLAVTRQANRIRGENFWTFYDMMGYGKDELEICSLGGGPGCDLIGLLRLRSIEGLGDTKKINCTVIDICSGWQLSMKDVFNTFLNSSEGNVYKNKLMVRIITANLLDRDLRLVDLKRVITTDVLMLVKFVSAIPSEFTAEILEVIFRLMKPGAYVFFLDNANGNAYKTTETAAVKAGLLSVLPVVRTTETVSSENLPSIGPLKINVWPLRSTTICSSVWQKPK